jgi:iron complex transport system ATP-binding protein
VSAVLRGTSHDPEPVLALDPQEASAVLAAERIHLRHPRGTRDVVRDLSLAVVRGEILALVGPNGSGKSTTLAALAGAMAPRQGRVLLDGRDLRGVPSKQRARRLARLPQSPACAEGLTVEDLVLCGRHPHRRPLAGPGEADRSAVRRALHTMGLADLRQRRVETLSGGERRRAWLAMILAQEAEVLLLDEPTAGLDLRHQLDLLELLRSIHRDHGRTILLVLHDLEQAARIADRIAVLHRGRLYEADTPERCLRPELLRDVFAVAVRVRDEETGLRLVVTGPATPSRSL